MATNIIFYDVECLKNIFTVGFYMEPCDKYPSGCIDMFYLSTLPINNFEEVTDRIYLRNGNFRGEVHYFDLRQEQNAVFLATMFGGMDDEMRHLYGIGGFPSDISIHASGKEELLYYLAGYNSYNYDTGIMAYMFAMMFLNSNGRKNYSVEQNPFNDPHSIRVSPHRLREFNDIMFSDKNHMTKALRPIPVANQIRKNMIQSGRHIDIARLNEKQQKVGLKRLLGTLGYQILESDKLSDTKNILADFDEICELIAYNVSDIVNLAQLAHHKLYASNFELKQGLLDSYPEIVIDNYDKTKPIPVDAKLRRDRKTADSSSSQIASMALCPHGHLKDYNEVSFMYPAPEKAIEQNRSPENILKITNDWFCTKFPDPLSEPRQYWSRVYRLYSYIEGKNFNQTLEEETFIMPKMSICMPYFDKEGNPTSGYVTFSVGGIHGAEYNKGLYDHHMKEYREYMNDMEMLKEELSLYEIPMTHSVSKRTGKALTKYGKPEYKGTIATKDEETKARIFHKLKTLVINGKTYDSSDYVNGNGKWKKKTEPQLFVDKNEALPGFPEDDTIYNRKKLNKKYTYTSYGLTEHEDFTSYYPNMLIQMMALYNDMLGYDRYEEIFEQKETLGAQMKDETLDAKTRDVCSIKRNGTKLVLNAASGAGDAKFDNPIRVNNKIISMRIIGQMFTWRIGQSQTFAGARVPSTNTDGLYVIPVAPLTVEESRRILEEESRNIHVAIEPEPVYLISKDTNNRLEYDCDKQKIIGAGGGSLSCYGGPTPAQALSHPAAIDKALSEYLLDKCLGNNGTDAMDEEFDEALGMRILDELRNDKSLSLVKRALYFQNMVASSPGTNSYNFYYKKDVETPLAEDIVKIVQHYNRVFYFNRKDYTVHMQRIHMRKATGLKKGCRPPHQLPGMLLKYCEATGERPDDVDAYCQAHIKELTISKITGITPEMNILIENHDLHQLGDDHLSWILSELDMGAYLDLLRSAYNNWRNQTPDCEFETADEEEEAE